MKYEVRCCCKPEKLVGWIDTGGALQGKVVRFAAVNGDMIELELALFNQASSVGPLSELRERRQYIALKDNHVPVERLRTLRCFTENV